MRIIIGKFIILPYRPAKIQPHIDRLVINHDDIELILFSFR